MFVSWKRKEGQEAPHRPLTVVCQLYKSTVRLVLYMCLFAVSVEQSVYREQLWLADRPSVGWQRQVTWRLIQVRNLHQTTTFSARYYTQIFIAMYTIASDFNLQPPQISRRSILIFSSNLHSNKSSTFQWYTYNWRCAQQQMHECKPAKYIHHHSFRSCPKFLGLTLPDLVVTMDVSNEAVYSWYGGNTVLRNVGDHLRYQEASPQYGLWLNFETSKWGVRVTRCIGFITRKD